MNNIDPATRIAYVDGELDEIAARRVEQAMLADPSLAALVAQDRSVRARVQARFAPYAEAPVPDRFRALLETNVVPIRPQAASSRRSGVRWIQAGAIAAALVLGVAIGQQRTLPGMGSLETEAMTISPRLTTALDTQLASTQPSDALIRVGLTFRNEKKLICRGFTTDQMQGIACRDNGAWKMRIAASGERSSRYRQAGSPILAEQAAQMMVGSPFTAAQEADAKANGWR